MRRAAIACLAGVLFAQTAGAGNPSGAPADWPDAGHEPGLQAFFLAEQLEYRWIDGDDELAWEAEAWLGGPVHRLWLESEGELAVTGSTGGEAELQALYGRAIAPFWDLRIGLRGDALFGGGPNRQRGFAVLDLHGLAPLWFELTPALFVSDDGDVSFRLTASTEVLLTQRWIVEPRVELDAAADDARRFGIESGLNELELGLRLRYELRRELAPYLGLHWRQRLGHTADLARGEGESVRELGAVVGLRLWF